MLFRSDPFGGRDPISFVSTAPPNIGIMANDLRNAKVETSSVGFSQQLGGGTAVNVDVINQHTSRLPLTVNVAPDPVKVGTLFGVTEINDGNTLEIQETRMRLYGIDAPDLGQECMLNGLPYQCGVVAYTHLIDLLAGKGRITCYASKLEGDDRPYAKCGLPTANGADIRADTPSFNEMMVRAGWALANRSHTNDYVPAEDEARKEKRGLWAGEFVNPSEWRNGKR